MTLEEKARKYADSQIGCGDGYYEWGDVEQAYLAGAKELEKENKTLEGCLLTEQELTQTLEKENEELKELIVNSKKDGISPINALIIKNLAQQVEEYKNGNFVQTVNQIIEGKDKRLEQAIDLIKKCMKVMEFHDCEYTEEYKQADQFIKENNNG